MTTVRAWWGSGSVSAPKAALVCALGLFAALAVLGARYHWVEEAGTAERDGYVAKAEELLSGIVPRDPYRPLLYPVLIAGLSLGLDDPFLAARLLSNASAAALAWLAFAFGRRLGGPVVGGWAMALTAANPNLWILGQHTTTDFLFACLAGGALLKALDYARGSAEQPRPRGWTALAVGGFLGLACFTRGNAVFLLPGLLLAWWWGRSPVGKWWAHLGAAAGAALVLLLPHFWLRANVFGDPFYSENWKNLAFKLYGFPDWSYLERVPFPGLSEVLLHDPVAVLLGGLAEVGRFLTGGLSQLLGTWLHAGLFGIGASMALRRRSRTGLLLLTTGGVFVAATAFAFFTWGRLLLVLLPLANALAAWSLMGARDLNEYLCSRLGPPPPWSWARFVSSRWLISTLALAVVLLLAAKTFAFRMPAFIRNHPYIEVATLQRLETRLPAAGALAGTSPFLGRYLKERERYLYVPDARGEEVDDAGLYYVRLEQFLLDAGVKYLVVGRIDLRERPASLLSESPPVPWLRYYASRRGVWVFEVTL